MKKIILLLSVFCVFCVGALHAQTPVRGLTVTGALDTMRAVETTPRFVSPTGALFKRPVMTISGEILQIPETTPLTFEARKAGATVTFTPAASLSSLSIEYSLNGSAWAPYTTPITLTNVGDSVSFRGTNNTYATSFSAYSNFSCSDSCFIYGNIMSLISKDNFANNTTLTTNYTFCKLFYENDKINIHTTKELMLPATTLVRDCYSYMFYGCTSLTTAPALPATTLANSCYSYMFYGCTSLTTAPALPATTLANSCYSYMFYGCTSLTTAPALPATTLANSCYSYMFRGCTSLTTAPELPATTLQESCYRGMFANCSNLTTAPELPATTLQEYCYSNMFAGCSSLTTAPVLLATTLANYCYSDMFASCFKLTTAPALPATTLADYCYAAMFMYCTSLTTAPELPATTLVNACYQNMFHGCFKLTTSPVLPA
ncbi:MAG: hypothetical protein J5644_03190, partial [Bacteroidales bacterium]|nr:hypothetical protein [Bacteroidales bacterium]